MTPARRWVVRCLPLVWLLCQSCTSTAPVPRATTPSPSPGAALAPPIAAVAQPAGTANEPRPSYRPACPNFTRVMGDAQYPKAALKSGVFEGNVVVRFRIVGKSIEILRVTSSDAVFEEQAVAIVKGFDCNVDKPTVMEVPIKFKIDDKPPSATP